MDKLIAAFTENIVEALAIAKKSTIHIPKTNFQHIVICGMGGSGIGGRLVSQWIQSECPIPIIPIHDYEIPAFVGKNSLVIGSSYSGNTEETLIALEAARTAGAHIIGVCSGGLLETFCADHQLDCIVVPGGNPPRTALAFSIVQLLHIFAKFGFCSSERLSEILLGKELIEKELALIHEEAKKTALFLFGKVPAIYAGADYEALTIRSKQQFNENSKELCWQHVIPEMNHNELVGWGGGDDRFAALFFQTGDLSARNQRRFDISVEVMKSKTDQVLILEAKGNSRIERSLYLIHLIDWASFYLSQQKNGDPIEIKVIDFLKGEMSKMKG